MTVNGDNPDTNIFLVAKVENLAGLVMDSLLQITPATRCQKKQLKKAADALDEWQTGRLFLLRKAFE
jgi:hypothetical protein